MFPCIILTLLLTALPAAEKYTDFRSGPFYIYTSAGDKAGRETLLYLEQLRQAMGLLLGKTDPQSVWPIRVVVRKAPALEPKLARDAVVAAAKAGEPLSRQWVREFARMFLEANAGRMPADIESGLLDLVSTLEVKGTRVTLGAPPPPAERTPAWARLHMLAVDPRYASRVRILLSNFQQGADPVVAYKNAFELKAADVDRDAQAYFSAGQYGVIALSGKPIDPDRDFQPRPVDDAFAALLEADLLLREPSRARPAYEAVLKQYPGNPDALEGLGLVDLAEGNKEQATKQLAAAVKAGSKSPRPYLETGDYATAFQRNPKWAEVFWRHANSTTDHRMRVELMKKATAVAPRETAYWRMLAESATATNQFDVAARAWMGAARSAATDDERAKLTQARLDLEAQRLEAQAEARRLAAEAEQRDLERLKAEALARVRSAEDKADQGKPLDPKTKVEEWWDDGKEKARVTGALERVDCLKQHARLVIRTDAGKMVQLLIVNPGQVVISGGGEQQLGCGAQKPAKRVAVEYVPKADAKLGVAGEATLVEFQR